MSPRDRSAGQLSPIRAAFVAALLLFLSGCAGSTPGPGSPSRTDRGPRSVAGGWLFSYDAPPSTRSVHLAGEFNGWSMTATPMSDADGDGAWTTIISLEPGRSYQYKFVVNGSEWVTDPNAEAVDPANFNNGIVYTRRPGEPFIADLLPADGAHLGAVPSFGARVVLPGATAGTPSLVLRDFMEQDVRTIPIEWDVETGRIRADLPGDLADGEYALELTVPIPDGSPIIRKSSFGLDRWTGHVDAPEFYDGAVIYEIFVRSFRDARGNDGIGDIEGLIGSLDYLNDGDPETSQDLGVDALWLMPVHPSPSYHGYDVTDYQGIEEDFGNLEDYRRLVVEAHRRGMRVILDYVVNHSSNAHPFFEDAHGNPSSDYSQWYKFTDDGNRNYRAFADYQGMPEFDFRSAEMRDYLIEIARFWMDLDLDGDYSDGVDGFRCDVAKGPPHNFWKQLRRETKAARSDFLLLGEVWDNAETIAPYFHSEFDMNFDYPLYYKLLDLLAGKVSGQDFMDAFKSDRRLYPPGAQLCRFLDNHDNNRIASVLGGDERRIRLATGLLLMLPGTPLIYYGTEVGMTGTKPDPDLRRPMRWDLVEAQTNDGESLLSWHRNLIRLRQSTPELRARDDETHPTLIPGRPSRAEVMAFQRRLPGATEATVVVANLSAREIQTEVRFPPAALLRGRLSKRLEPGVAETGPSVDFDRGTTLRIPGYGLQVFRLTGE